MRSANVYIGTYPGQKEGFQGYGVKLISDDGETLIEFTGECACRPGSAYPILKGLIQIMSRLDEPTAITLHTDSAYICNSIQRQYVQKWQANGWMQANGKKASFSKTWQKVLELTAEKGHKLYATKND